MHINVEIMSDSKFIQCKDIYIFQIYVNNLFQCIICDILSSVSVWFSDTSHTVTSKWFLGVAK